MATPEDYYYAFIAGYLGPEKAHELARRIETWRLLDAFRYGVMHRIAKEGK